MRLGLWLVAWGVTLTATTISFCMDNPGLLQSVVVSAWAFPIGTVAFAFPEHSKLPDRVLLASAIVGWLFYIALSLSVQCHRGPHRSELRQQCHRAIAAQRPGLSTRRRNLLLRLSSQVHSIQFNHDRRYEFAAVAAAGYRTWQCGPIPTPIDGAGQSTVCRRGVHQFAGRVLGAGDHQRCRGRTVRFYRESVRKLPRSLLSRADRQLSGRQSSCVFCGVCGHSSEVPWRVWTSLPGLERIGRRTLKL